MLSHSSDPHAIKMANRLINDEVKIAFFSKHGADAKPVSNETMGVIVNGIRTGIQRCVDRKKDVDMFCCLQGDRYIPNARPILLYDLDATMVSAANGHLRFLTNQGGHILNVIVSGGANSFEMGRDVPRSAGHAGVPHAVAPPAPAPPAPAAAASKPKAKPASKENRKRNKMRPLPESPSESEEEPQEIQPRRHRNHRNQQCKVPPKDLLDSSSDSSEAQDLKHFSQLTGRGRHSGGRNNR
ncbi:hypothetical protein SEMRO_901_G217960.1 [Seminavis robusta]|uniref:Uncharacterized protein n=1 Tax=Seminavis robusta TaxID=568900 RepID=A0A9N8EAV5_9STRA|nr:hypothetical protein SEMRO_901_G217960.1 [Seminavis robusta]|eukprot:Sro901_g217960.1 n/a (241) ;mRNA; f:9262-9984